MAIHQDRTPLSHLIYDQSSHLIACQPGDSPGGEGDAVNGADISHPVMIRQQGGHIAETAAISCVYHEEQHQDQYREKHAGRTAVYNVSALLCDGLSNDHKAGSRDGEHKDDLIYRVPVFHGVSPCGEAQPPACIEHRRDGGQDPGHSAEADTLDDHLLLRDQGETTGDIQVEHDPDAYKYDRLCLDDIESSCALFLLCRLMPARRLCQEQMPHEHHHKIYGGQDQEHLPDAVLTQGIQKRLHDRACDSLGRAEAKPVARPLRSSNQSISVLTGDR